MTRKRFVLLVNPRGGIQHGLGILEQIRPRFRRADAVLDVHVTKYAGHAAELARTLPLEGVDGLCLIGGDGTIHEVVNGLLQRDSPTAVPLGLIPGGTGNSVLLHLGCTSWENAVDRILAGVPQPADVARVTWSGHTVYCLNIVGWGCVVDINHTAERWRWLGRSRYTLSALVHILRAKRRWATLTLDGRATEDEFLFILGCNTKFTGKAMKLAPRAELADGMIDVVLVRRASRIQLLKLFQRVFDGTHLDLPSVEYHQVQSFAIDTKLPEDLNLDGELKGHSPVNIVVRPAAITIFG